MVERWGVRALFTRISQWRFGSRGHQQERILVESFQNECHISYRQLGKRFDEVNIPNGFPVEGEL